MRARLLLLPLALVLGVFLLWNQTHEASPPASPGAGTGPSEPHALDSAADASAQLATGASEGVEAPPPIGRTTVPSAPTASTAPALDPEQPIQGRVLGPDGAPVAGAEIWITQGNSTRLEFHDTAARSDGEGRFSLPEQRMRVFGLLAAAEGRGGALGGTYTLHRKEAIELELDFPAAPSVAGEVVWEDGSPASGAVVDAFGTLHVRQFLEPDSEVRDNVTGFARIGWATADSGGAFRLAGLASDFLRLRATATAEDGSTWMAFAQPVAPGQTQVKLRLRPLSALEIAVVDDRGEPVPEIRLRSTPLFGEALGSAEPESRRQELSATDGVFQADGFFAGSWRIEVYAKDHWPQLGASWPIVSVPTTERIPVTIWRIASATGQVIGSNGQPLADVPIELWSDRFQAGRASQNSSTDSQGRYRFPSLQPGANYIIVAGVRGTGPELSFSPRPGQALELPPLVLDPGGDLLVRLLDANGEPWPNRPIALLGSERTITDRRSDSEGRALFEELRTGEYLVLASGKSEVNVTGSPEDAELARATAEIRVGQTTEIVLQELPMESTEVAGRLLVNGSSAPGIQLMFLEDGALVLEAVGVTETDEEGAFRSTLPRPGLYRWMTALPGRRGPSSGSGFIRVPPGGVADLQLQGATGSLSIIAGGESGPPQEWLVFAGPSTPVLPGVPTAKSTSPATAAGEGWSLEDLLPGPYLVRAMDSQTKSLVASQEALVEGGKTTRVVLEPLSFESAELDVSAVLPELSDAITMVELAVWGAVPEPIVSIPITYTSGPVPVQLPQDATCLALAVGGRVAVHPLEPPPWPDPIRLQAQTAGFLHIDQDADSSLTGTFGLRVLDADGRNWSRIAYSPDGGMNWFRNQIFHGRWSSPPLPPGTYTLDQDGRIQTVQVRAGERTPVTR